MPETDEISVAMQRFGEFLAERPDIRPHIEPYIDGVFNGAQFALMDFEETPSRETLAILSGISQMWPDTARKYKTSVDLCSSTLGDLNLGADDEKTVREGHEALKIFVDDLEETLQRHQRVYETSILAESRIDRFRTFVSEKRLEIVEHFANPRVSEGGVIYCDGDDFEMEFIPNLNLTTYEDLLQRTRKGDKAAQMELYEISNVVVSTDMNLKTEASSFSDAISSYTGVLVDLSFLAQEGVVTERLEDYLRSVFSIAYRFSADGILGNDALFGEEMKLFGFFSYNKKDPSFVYPKGSPDVRKEDIRNSYTVGPVTVFCPGETDFRAYLVSLGEMHELGTYPIDLLEES